MSLGHEDSLMPPKSQPKSPETFKDAAKLSRHLLGASSAAHAARHDLSGSAGTQQSRSPCRDGDWGQEQQVLTSGR